MSNGIALPPPPLPLTVDADASGPAAGEGTSSASGGELGICNGPDSMIDARNALRVGERPALPPLIRTPSCLALLWKLSAAPQQTLSRSQGLSAAPPA